MLISINYPKNLLQLSMYCDYVRIMKNGLCKHSGAELPAFSSQSFRQRGFALIITLTLMILLVVIAVGLLTLSTISLRNSSQSQNQAIAQANARLALQLAIGELQRTMGPDQRVSAPADSLTTAAPLTVHPDWQHATAVLKHTEDALLPPDETPTAKVNREFAGWLVSGDPAITGVLGSAATAMPSRPTTLLLMKGITPEPDVRAPAVTVTTARGQSRYAWWVEDLGTKASMGLPTQPNTTLSVLAPDRFDPRKIAGLEAAPAKDSEQWDRLPTTNTSELILANAKDITRTAGRPVTAVHRGVLADVAKGRLKRDLTVAFAESKTTMESWLGQKIYDPVGGSDDPGGPHWEQLRQYYQSGTNGTLTIRPQTADQEGYYPVIAGMTEIYGISNTQGYAPSAAPQYAANFYNDRGTATSPDPVDVMTFHMSPVIKLWNPYDRPLNAPAGYTVAVVNGNSQYSTGPADYDASYQDRIGWGRSGSVFLWVRPPKTVRYEHRYFIPAVTIGPGETKIFSLTGNRFLDVDGAYRPWDPAKNFGARTNVVADGWILGDLTDVTDSGGFTGHSFWDLSFTKLANIPLSDRERWNWVNGRSQQGGGGDIQILDTNNPAGLTFEVKPHPFTTWSIRLFAGRQSRPGLDSRGRSYNADPEAPLVNIRNINTNTTGFRKSSIPLALNPNPATEPFFLNPTGQASMWARRFVLKLAENEGDGTPALYNPENGKTKDAKWLANFNPRSPTVGCWPKEHARPATDSDFTAIPRTGVRINGTANSAPYGTGTPGNFLSGMLSSFTSQDALYLNKAIGFSDIAGPEKTILFQTPPAINPEQYFFSIGQLGHANLWIENGTYQTDVTTDRHSTEDWFSDNMHPAYPIGNSYADPRLKLSENQGRFQDLTIVDDRKTYRSSFHDISYYLNRSLWDAYFLSARKNGLAGSYNSRLEPLTDVPLPSGKDGFDHNAAKLLLAGAFNINSTNPDAWAAFLASLCDVTVGSGGTTANAAYPRVLPPQGDEVDSGTTGNDDSQYTGFRALSESEIKDLAVKIVDQIKLRGPSTSFADFINRSASGGSLIESQIKGLLQAAIDETSINERHRGSSGKYTIPEMDVDSTYEAKAFAGDIAASAPGYLTQADLLTRLGPLMVPRSDTFVIRCRGEALDKSGNVLATAVCEATVQRLPEYVDPAVDSATEFTALPANSAARTFGRKFSIVSFRWLNLQEI